MATHTFTQSEYNRRSSIPNLNSNIPNGMSLAIASVGILPSTAQKKLQSWIRSRHLICSRNFFIFETLDYTALERFSECIAALGGTVISVDSIGKIWIGAHRQIILYRVRASLHTPHHDLKQYWIKCGSFRTRFAQQI
jgi:phycoerythrin-associated linker protein